MTESEIQTRFCTYCAVRHPIDDFTGYQEKCKWSRGQEQKENARKNIKNPKDLNYEKYCKLCKEEKNAHKEFRVDNSRPDGFELYCRSCGGAQYYKNKTLQINAILSGHPKQFRKKLIRTVLKTVIDSDRSIVRQLVEDFRHEGERVSFAGREWQIQIMNDMRPNIVIRKPSQKGLTWLLERFVFALLMRYRDKPYKYKDHTGIERSRFPEAIYSFETSTKASSWSKVRLKKIKDDNIHVRDALKIGETDSALLMKLGRCALHLVGRATISGVLSISGDIVIIDEKDRDENPAVASQIGSRTLESVFMNTPSTKGVTRETSTPEVSGAGISLQYEESDEAEWAITCVECGTEQIMTYPESIGNFYEKGDEPFKDPETGYALLPFWKCKYCNEPIDWKTIGVWNPKDPDHYENCRWIVQKPLKYNKETGAGIGGYQVPFAGPQRSAPFFIAERDDPEHDNSYLYNHMLGLPYDDVTKTLVKDNFHVRADFDWGFSRGDQYVLGCDHGSAQGGFIVIYRQIKGTVSPAKPEGKWVVVYVEHVENNRNLWDDTETISDIQNIKKGRIYELITEFNVSLAVLDIEPDTNEVDKMIDEFGFSKQVWCCKSSGTVSESFAWEETKLVNGNEIPVCRITENKVAAIDYYFNRIRFGDILYLEPEKYPGRSLWQKFQDSHTNLYKGEVAGKAGQSAVKEKLAAMNITEIYKMRQNKIKDHWVMAGKFGCHAIRLLNQVNLSMSHLAPPKIHTMGRIPGT